MAMDIRSSYGLSHQRRVVKINGTLRDFAGLIRTKGGETKKGLQVIDFLATL
jgi:hypothetical protein